jgi:hypothetical protein
VPWLKKILVLALVAVWSLAANHCKLEQLPGFQFLKCGDSASTSAHPEADCQTDGCATVESSFYKSEDVSTAMPLLAKIILVVVGWEKSPSVAQNNFTPVSAPPEFAGGWQFVFRTAAPPRAPAFTS